MKAPKGPAGLQALIRSRCSSSGIAPAVSKADCAQQLGCRAHSNSAAVRSCGLHSSVHPNRDHIGCEGDRLIGGPVLHGQSVDCSGRARSWTSHIPCKCEQHKYQSCGSPCCRSEQSHRHTRRRSRSPSLLTRCWENCTRCSLQRHAGLASTSCNAGCTQHQRRVAAGPAPRSSPSRAPTYSKP